MSNSSLVNYKLLTGHFGYPTGKAGRGGNKIDKIFVHHMAGNLTVEQCGKVFKNNEASAHYGIDGKGRVGQYVLEENTAWHCANKTYNQRSIGIELANDGGAKTNWHVSDKTIAKCIDLIVDICKRNGIKKINYTGNLNGNLCMHCWTASTACPGGYMKTKFKYIAEQVNKKLSGTPVQTELYRVRKTWADSKSQVGAYKVLENAKKIADEKGLNVYDSKGNLVYASKKADGLYRVRKSWADAKSQVGAYKDLSNAKKVADEKGLNVYDSVGKLVYEGKKKDDTRVDKANAWAKKIADDKYHYVVWTSNNPKTKTCPICKGRKYNDAFGWNCIGLAFAYWHHGMGLSSNCNCGVIGNKTNEKILNAKTDAEALSIARKQIGLNDIKVIRNKSGIPKSQWKAGDILMAFDKNGTYYHTFVYAGNGQIFDSTRAGGDGSAKNIKFRSYKSYSAKLLVRYIGK